MMKDTTISTRITKDLADNLAKIAGTKNAGAAEACEGYIYIRRATWIELKGLFTKNEVLALLEAYNGTMLMPNLQTNSALVRAQMEDAEKYEGACANNE